jgi:hypothetical protein
VELSKIPGGYAFDKELNSLDRFVLDYVSVLDKEKIKYVIVSGYVAILFGRSRSSEDVDMFIEKISSEKFFKLWEDLSCKFECLNTRDPVDAYDEYLLNDTALRFSYPGKFIPNMETKFPKKSLDFWTLEHSQKVLLNKKMIHISSIEVQIPFKLFLGSEKDLEDAAHLYEVFKQRLDIGLTEDFARRLGVEKEMKRFLK